MGLKFELPTFNYRRSSFTEDNPFCLHIILGPMFFSSLLTQANNQFILASLFFTRKRASVYHKPTIEPYVIPSISDYPRHAFINIVQNTFIRAVRYSSTFEAFHCE